jgi:hypothetical protein
MEKIEFLDHSRILQLPLTTMVLNFSCPKCSYSAPFHVIPGKSIPESFGTCSRCKTKMLAQNLALDVDKLLRLLKDEHGITITMK